MLALTLRYRDRIYYRELAEGQQITFGSGKKDTMQIREMAEAQLSIRATGELIALQTRQPFTPRQETHTIGSVIRLDEASGASLFVSRATGIANEQPVLPYDGVLRIGRAEANDISIGLPFVSGKHFQLRVTDGNVRVEDLDSSNGLYLNGQRIKAATFRPGDELQILTVRIRRVNNTLQFENVGTSLKLRATQTTAATAQEHSSNGSQTGNARAIITEAAIRASAHNSQAASAAAIRAAAAKSQAEAATKPQPPLQQKYLRHRLSPRIQDQLPQEPIILDRPPKKGQEYHPSGSRLASLLSMGAMAGSTLAIGVASPALAVAKAASLVAGAYNMVASSKMDKQRREQMEEYNRRREEEYRTYIEAQRARIMAVAAEQRRILTEENPEPTKCIEMAETTARQLWERMPTDRDFLDVRMGMGYEDLCVPIKNYAENRGLMLEDDELEDLCNTIAEENQVVDYVPTRLAMRSTPTVGIVGNRDQTIHLVRNMMVSLTAHHCPNDVQLVGIFDDSEKARWAAMRWLPHIWDNSHQFRYLAFDKDRAHHLCEILYDVLKRRVGDRRDDTGRERPAPTPHYVVILGSRDLVDGEPLLELLTANDPQLGVTTLFLYDDLYYLPRQCGYFIDLSQEHPSAYGKHEANRRIIFSRDASVSNTRFNAYARRLAAIELKEDRKQNALPSSLSFMEGLGVKTVEELNILQRWRSNKVNDSLSAPIGVMAAGKHFHLDVHYRAHGAHGLLAGTTGSGKSELLRTWILSMAVNYHPHEVNFVIIDYKGGGMANKLDALPHVVGKITNIDTNINRTLVSLKREAKRRMKLLEGYPGVDDVDQYMQLYYAGKATEPMPHLLIVSDEFAELKKEEPEFMKELNTLARVGRSVGIHLLLATQRPTGLVDDQIDSNSRFRICMKVNSIQDSKDIIKKPDAAAITQRGRAYVRIGEDEVYELFQSYWSGAEYAPEQTVSRQLSNQVSIVDVSGERIQVGAKKQKVAIGADQLTAIVNHIVEQAELAGIVPLEGPWKPELPTLVKLQELGVTSRFLEEIWKVPAQPLAIPIGIFDRPAMQEQGIQYLDFTATPHYGIYGGPGAGKTTLLKTVIFSLTMTFSPADVNLYILDFGGRSLGAFGSLPHTAMVIQEDQEEQLWRFADWIRGEMNRRKRCFEQEKVANFDQYRRQKQDMPAIFVVVDNLLRMTTLYEKTEALLQELSMIGSDCGVHLLFTSNNINKTSMNLRTNIGGSIALRMTDRNDYRTAVAELPEGCGYPANPGRALIRDTSVAEVQTAIFQPVQNDAENQQALLDALVNRMRLHWTDELPEAVKVMPQSLSVQDLAAHYEARAVLPVGLSHADVQPVFLDLRQQNRMLISGQTAGLAAESLKAMAQLLLSREDNLVYILDGDEALRELSGSSNRLLHADGLNNLSRLVNELFTQISLRQEDLITLEDLGGTVDPETFPLRYPQICILINRMHLVMEKLSPQAQERLVNICQASDPLGVIVIGGASAMDIGTYMCKEDLTIALVGSPDTNDAHSGGSNYQKGLCLGGKVRNHDSFVQNGLSNEQKTYILEQGDAMVFDCGTATRIKTIS